MQFMTHSYRGHLPLILLASLLIVLALSYLWLHLVTPFDNGRLRPGSNSITAAGVVVAPLDTGPVGLQAGDVVTIVNGRPIESWVKALFDGGVSRPRWQAGDVVRYTVIRDGKTKEVAVTLGRYPLGAIVLQNWGTVAFALLYLSIATYVFLRRPDVPAVRPLFLSGAALLSATTWSLGAQVSDLVDGIGIWLFHTTTIAGFMLIWIASFHFALVFPRPLGVVARQRWIMPVIYGLPYLLLGLFLLATRPGATNALYWMSGWGRTTTVHAAVFLSLTLAAIVWQYRTNRMGVTRRQIRWLVLAALVVGGSALLFYFLPPLIGGRAADSNVIGLVGVLFPLAVAIAILRQNLFDIDTLLNRTLVYGALTAGTMGLYVFIVGYLGSLLQARDRSLIAFLTTGLVAVLFQPLREHLQRGVNRLMYGEWDDPYAVLSRLGRRLEATLSPAATLPTVVETVAQALKLPYVALALHQDEELEIMASYGLPDEEPIRLPLTFQSEAIGQLILAPRTPGELFTPAERRLLTDIAHQAGVAAQAVRLTNDLKHLAADLQRSRERLVTAREEERRRLRRDLHDGLGPQLASLTLKLDAVRNLLEDDPNAADALLVELKVQTQTAIADIRRLVYNLRPPALDELGLVGALREHAAIHNSANGLKTSIEAPPALPVLPAATEVAAYRIALEAMTNVARHARAQECIVRLALDEELHLEISDDGVGLPETGRRGVGLTSMHERAAVLGGKCVVKTGPTGGTQVLAQLPLSRGP